MIVCSCNVLSDKQVAAVLVGKPGPLRMSQVYACLSCRAQCGRCVVTIKRIQNVLCTSAEIQTSSVAAALVGRGA